MITFCHCEEYNIVLFKGYYWISKKKCYFLGIQLEYLINLITG